ncbi:hypothetical protein B7463_g555, partial [Scytalidium lignicola]
MWTPTCWQNAPQPGSMKWECSSPPIAKRNSTVGQVSDIDEKTLTKRRCDEVMVPGMVFGSATRTVQGHGDGGLRFEIGNVESFNPDGTITGLGAYEARDFTAQDMNNGRYHTSYLFTIEFTTRSGRLASITIIADESVQTLVRSVGAPALEAAITAAMLAMSAYYHASLIFRISRVNSDSTDAYYRGLKEEVKDEISKMEERPKTLSDLITKAVQFDNRNFERKLEKKDLKSYSDKSRTKKTTTTEKDPDAMDVDAVSKVNEQKKRGNKNHRKLSTEKKYEEYKEKKSPTTSEMEWEAEGSEAINRRAKRERQREDRVTAEGFLYDSESTIPPSPHK